MDVTQKMRLGWERRLPEINPPWTHWRLLGDGRILADVPAGDVLAALRIVEANFQEFKIKASRVAYDATGDCGLEDKALFQIEVKHATRK
jgi:hypothetical protein